MKSNLVTHEANGDVESHAGNGNGSINPSLERASSTVTKALEQETKLSAAGWKAVLSCINYSFCSVSMILVNKSLASRYECKNVVEVADHIVTGDLISDAASYIAFHVAATII
jgi:hypothetical protein